MAERSSPTEFEIRRTELVGVIGDSLEKVLQQLNTLNRNLEGIITIGNEFSAVEALWSQFEGVMGADHGAEGERDKKNHDGEEATTRGQYDDIEDDEDDNTGETSDGPAETRSRQ